MWQSSRPLYTEGQVNEYLEYIGQHDRISSEDCQKKAGLDFLNSILPLHQAKIPFENLDLHYSLHHTVSLEPEFLFHKIVTRNAGRGGYCMQNNLFFSTILRSLGYKVMPCGARVSSAAGGVKDPADISYTGWAHTVSLVYIEGRKYFVDVGFGANTSTIAIPLIDGWSGRHFWNDHDDSRLDLTHIHDNTFQNEEQKMWVWSTRAGEHDPWLPQYCFSELEFLPQDFAVMSFNVSKSLHSLFTYSIMARTCLLDDEGRDIGDLTLFNSTFKQRKYGKSETLLEAHSESERVRGLEKYFGIKLDSSEKAGITNYITMLKG